MKRKILAVLMAGALASCGTVVASAEETKDTDTVQEESTAEDTSGEEIKTIGIQDENAYDILLTNNTGKGIKDIRIVVSGEDEYEDAENLLKEEDIFADGEQRCLYFAPEQEEETEESEESEESEEEKADSEEDKDDAAEKDPVIYDIRLVFEDDTEAELHTFPFGDIKEGEIKVDGEISYIVFESLVLKEEVNTLETEKDLAEKKKAAEAPAQTSSQNYSQSYDYEDYGYYEDYDNYEYYEDSSYDDTYYEEPSQDDGGDTSGQDDGGATSNEDSCLDGGLLY